jgi:hypothetical protein
MLAEIVGGEELSTSASFIVEVEFVPLIGTERL